VAATTKAARPLQPDPAAVVVIAGRPVMALRVQVRRLDGEAHIPARAVAADGRKQQRAARRKNLLPGVVVEVRPGAEQPPQPASVVVHPDRADPR
jgi:hypothetical protein